MLYFSRILSLASGVARAFSGGGAAEQEDQIKETNEEKKKEKIRENICEWGKLGNVPLLPIRVESFATPLLWH